MEHVDILLVEDNANDAELAKRALQKKNLANSITWVKDGAEANDFLFCKGQYEGRDIHDKPRVVLLDLKLPKVDGLEVLKAVKADDRLKTIPVVVLTSSQEESDLVNSYNLGANSFIVKPVDFDNFTNAISEIGYYWMVVNYAK